MVCDACTNQLPLIENFNPIFPYMWKIDFSSSRETRWSWKTDPVNVNSDKQLRTLKIELNVGKLKCVVQRKWQFTWKLSKHKRNLLHETFMRTFMTVVDGGEVRQRNSMQAFPVIFKSYVKWIFNLKYSAWLCAVFVTNI